MTTIYDYGINPLDYNGRPVDVARLTTDSNGNTVLVGADGVPKDRFPLPLNPNGLDWLTDTISGFDIYDMGFVKRPTIFFDPTATTSLNRGTYANPYNTQAALQYAIAGNMAGQVVGFKRGTTLRATGTNGLVFTAYGASGSPLILCPYGDAEALPIVTGGAVVSTWALCSGSTTVYKYTMATESDIWQSDVRVWKLYATTGQRNNATGTTVTNEATAVTALGVKGAGWSVYVGGVMYFRPYDDENPNLGQVEVSVCSFVMSARLSDVAATGYMHIAGLDLRKGISNVCEITTPAVTAVTTAADVQVNGCRLTGGGTDNTASLGRDGIAIYGPSNGFLTGLVVRGNYCEGNLNNAIEIAYTDGAIIEFNRDTDHGGNSVELWSASKNAAIRYNIGENHDTTGRIETAVHMGGVWITSYNGTGSNVDQTTNINNVVEFNYFHNMANQGIDVYGGTGNKIRHNTIHQDATYTTNRLINFGTNTTAAGTISCEISNNFVLGSSVGSRFCLDVVSGAVNNSVGTAVTSTLTGDNNYYTQHINAGSNPLIRLNGSNYNSGTLATYKAAVSPFDANSTLTAGTTDGGAYIESDGSPSATFPGIGTGKTSLAGIGNRHLHGESYNPAAPTIGAMV